MTVSTAVWLKRALGVTALVLLSCLIGCGSPERTFAGETPDAAPDLPSNDEDVKATDDVAGDQALADISRGSDGATDGPLLDVSQGDARDASGDPPREVGIDSPGDVGLDVANDGGTVNPAPDAPGDVLNQPPSILSTVPANRATAVAVTTTISIDFTKAMNPATVTVTLQPAIALGSPIWNTGNTSVAFTPSTLAAMTTYTVTVAGSDGAGRPLSGPTTFSFTTGVGLDTTPPTLRGTVPVANATDVPIGTNIVITFTEPMDVGSVVLTSTPTITFGMPTFNTSNDQVSFTPTSPLVTFTEYTITVAGQDVAKNPLANPTTFKFTTARPPDTTPPTILSVAPTNGATAVPNNSSIVISFSEGMNLSATTAAITITPLVTCTGGWSWNQAGNTASCIPTAPLSYSTMYTVGVGAGARDLAGNPLASAFASSFVTGVMPDTTPPTITSVVPVNGATGVPRGAKIIVNFSEAMDITAAQSAFSVTSPGGIAGTFAWANGNTQMVFTPTALFNYATTVNWQVTTAAKDASGNAKTTLDSFSFNVLKTATANLPCLAVDGYVSNDGNISTTYTAVVAGGYQTTTTYRGIAAFDMSGLPTTITLINAATLYMEQYQVTGTPYGANLLGELLWRHVDIGPTLDAVDYSAATLIHTGATGGTLSVDALSQWKSTAVTASVRDDYTNRTARGSRSEYLLRFTNDTFATSTTAEYAYLYSCEAAVATDRPYISVTYEYP
jgi:hypothetical protein